MSKSKAYYIGERKEVAQLLPRTYSRVLEIGCGEGGFRENLNLECEYWGVELFVPAAEVASKKMDKVLVGTYQEVFDQLPKKYFDLVICNDVIEHMIDTDGFLRLIKNNMTDDACLVGSIPNVRYIGNLYSLIVKKDWQYTDDGILDRTHMRFFTERSLKRKILENDYRIELFTMLNAYDPEVASVGAGIKKLLYWMAVIVLGRDVSCVQFGIRIRAR